jgi:hypothetical protein
MKLPSDFPKYAQDNKGKPLPSYTHVKPHPSTTTGDAFKLCWTAENHNPLFAYAPFDCPTCYVFRDPKQVAAARKIIFNHITTLFGPPMLFTTFCEEFERWKPEGPLASSSSSSSSSGTSSSSSSSSSSSTSHHGDGTAVGDRVVLPSSSSSSSSTATPRSTLVDGTCGAIPSVTVPSTTGR